jgi:hypothetical protein
MGTASQIATRRSFQADFFARMTHAAGLAPSGDNLQPWSFGVDGDALLVRHDPTRDRSIFNVKYLASFIALGAAIENITIAASEEEYQAQVAYFPNGERDEIVGRISFAPGGQPDTLETVLDRRCTNRRTYQRRSIAPEILAALDPSKAFPLVNLSWIEESLRMWQLGKLVARADRLLFENQQIHNHLFSTLRWDRNEVERTRDGLPIESLELGKLGSIAFRCLSNWALVNFINHFGFSKIASTNSVKLMRRCSAAGLITVPTTSPASFLEAGRVFQRLWLSATQVNLALQPMTAIIFLQLRSRLMDYNGLTKEQIIVADGLCHDLKRFFALPEDRVPAMLFRIGFAAAPSGRTIRRLPLMRGAN